MPKLQISIPNVGDITHELSADEITIGRSADNKIQIKDSSVSVAHARLVRAEGGYQLEDLGSTNGTFLNGVQVTHKALEGSAALRFGNIAAFFHQEPAPKTDEVLKAELRKLQSQLAAVREARDHVHQRNQELLSERDEAIQAADIAAAELADFKLKSGAVPAEDSARIQELERQLAELGQSRTDLESRVREAGENAVARVRELEDCLAAAVQEREALEQKVQDTGAAVEEAHRLRTELEEVRNEARQGAESQAETRTRLEQELENIRQERDSATAQAQARFEELQSSFAASETDRQNAAEAAGRELAAAREEATALAGKLEAAEAGHRAGQENLEKEKQGLAAESETLRNRTAELVGELDQARAVAAGEGESMQATLNELRSQVAAARDAQTDAESARGKAGSDLKASQTELELLRGELQAIHDTRQGDLEERGRKIAALEAEKHALEQRLAREHESVSGARNEAEKASAELQGLRHELEDVRRHNETISKECEALRRRQQAMVGQLDEQKAAQAATSESTGDLTAALESARVELEALRPEKERADRLAGETEDLRKEIAARTQQQAEMITLREGLAALERERDEETRRANQVEEHFHESQRSHAVELDGLRKAQSAAEARLAEKDARLESQQVQVDNLRHQLETLAQKSSAPTPAGPSPAEEATPNGRGPQPDEAKGDGGRGLRPRRALGKIEQRLRGRTEQDPMRLAETGAAVATASSSRWGPEKQRGGAAVAGGGPPVFPEEVVAQDTVTLGKMPELITQARGDLQYLIRHPNDLKALKTLMERCQSMSDLARTTIFGAVYQMASALDSLLADLHATPERINQATLRTVTQSIDFMNALVEPERMHQTLSLPEPHVLIIDDESDIIEAIVGSMELVGLQACGSHDAGSAIEELGRAKFDLVFLDVGLPDISGWDVCQRIRGIPEHKRTPIVFVTGAASIENKVKSTLQGGNDFVGKPFNVREIGIKALSWVYRGQLGMI